jgi:hypothetical protein
MIIGLRMYSEVVELIDLLTSAIYDASRNIPWETE